MTPCYWKNQGPPPVDSDAKSGGNFLTNGQLMPFALSDAPSIAITNLALGAFHSCRRNSLHPVPVI